MKKIMILGLLVLVGLFIVGCGEEMTDDELDTALGELSDEDLEIAMVEEDSALAGNAKFQKYQSANPKKAKKIKAVSYSAKKKTRTYTCSDDGEEIVINRDGREIRRRAKFYCFGGNVKERYCKAERGTSFWRVYGTRISERCEANEECSEAQCVSLCGNAAVDEGETCSSCPADVSCGEGQECQENECVAVEVEAQGAEGEAIQLDDCNPSDDFWEEGQTYVLTQDIVVEGDPYCFYIHRVRGINDITLDCQGHSITGPGPHGGAFSGISVDQGRGITIRNCVISGFMQGLGVDSTYDSSFEDNTIDNTGDGIFLGAGSGNTFSGNSISNSDLSGIGLHRQSSNSTFTNNRVCGNSRAFDCNGEPGRSLGNRGAGNFFDGEILTCEDGWPQEGVHYSNCE